MARWPWRRIVKIAWPGPINTSAAPRSLCLALSRSLARSLPRSFVGSFVRSLARSPARRHRESLPSLAGAAPPLRAVFPRETPPARVLRARKSDSVYESTCVNVGKWQRGLSASEREKERVTARGTHENEGSVSSGREENATAETRAPETRQATSANLISLSPPPSGRIDWAPSLRLSQ